jgi:hypothetical protein
LFFSELDQLLVDLEPLPALDVVHVEAGWVLAVRLLPEVQELLLRLHDHVIVNVHYSIYLRNIKASFSVS